VNNWLLRNKWSVSRNHKSTEVNHERNLS
jgi:hypothetical protein